MWRIVLAVWTAAAAGSAQLVEGHVVNSATGAALPGVSVILGRNADHPELIYRATTDDQGRFRIDGVEDGVYTAFYQARGFWMVPFAIDPSSVPAFAVATGAQPVRLEAQMQPVPKLSGRVLDPLGVPVPNANVWVLEVGHGCGRPACLNVVKEGRSGPEGEFSFGDFDGPATWLVAAAPPSTLAPPEAPRDRRLGWAQTFYPAETDPQIATRIAAASGEVTSLDIKLAAVPVHRVHGRVLSPGGDPVPKAAVTLLNQFGSSAQATTGEKGDFEFDSVPDGDWRLSASLDAGRGRLWAVERVEVQSRDPEALDLRLGAAFSVRGKVLWEAPDGVPVPDAVPDVALSSEGVLADKPYLPRTPVGEQDGQGGMVFQNVYPGSYKVMVLEPAPSPFYLDSIRLGGADALGGEVPIQSDSQLVLTYKYGGGSVVGSIDGCGGAHVVLVPRDEALRRPEMIRETRCGPNGQFEFSGVRPGEYYGIALSGETWYAQIGDETMLGRAGKVSVRANEHTTADIALIKAQ